MDIWLILGNSILTAAILAGIAYLSRSIINRWIDRNLERYKKELQIELAEHQTKFTRLHQERADVIAEFYKRLVQLERNLGIYKFIQTNPEEASEEDEMLFFKKVLSDLGELRYYFYEKEIFLPEELCNRIKVLINIFNMASIKPDILDNSPGNKKLLNLSLYPEKLPDIDFPQLRIELKQEFRKILDVANL